MISDASFILSVQSSELSEEKLNKFLSVNLIKINIASKIPLKAMKDFYLNDNTHTALLTKRKIRYNFRAYLSKRQSHIIPTTSNI